MHAKMMTIKVMSLMVHVTVFFFSSRRRHTRLVSDWSSDVCSSDLDKLAANYAEKRARLLKILELAGFTVFKPRGAYYIMTDISRFSDPDPVRFAAGTKDVAFAKYLVQEIGVATVSGSTFYNAACDV